MTTDHAYPAELAQRAHERWTELERRIVPGRGLHGASALPDVQALERLVSVAYQASLLEEEERPVVFRLFVGGPESLAPEGGPPTGLHRLRFTVPRPYVEHEIRRLSPAVKYHRALIAVRSIGDDFEIWGLLQSGPRWLQSARGGRVLASPVPRDAVVVRVIGPGHMAIAVGDVMLAELRGGRIAGSPIDVFESKWLAARVARLRGELMLLHESAMQDGTSVPLDQDFTRVIAQQMIRRLISTIRAAHHGGTILLLPERGTPNLLGDDHAIRLKYAFVDEEPRRRYRTLIRGVMRELSMAGAELDPRPERVGFSLYQSSQRASVAELDEAILEMSQLLAALADVDGAVVMTERFEVLGFGAEIVGQLPEVANIRRADNLEATEYRLESIDGVGTRHRSAYRLCAHEHEALAIVVSHDGGVEIVAWHNDALTAWEHVSSTGADL